MSDDIKPNPASHRPPEPKSAAPRWSAEKQAIIAEATNRPATGPEPIRPSRRPYED